MSDKNYIVACNCDYDRRVFMIANFYQDPDTGERTPDEEGITELTHESFQTMTEEEFMIEFEAFMEDQQSTH